MALRNVGSIFKLNYLAFYRSNIKCLLSTSCRRCADEVTHTGQAFEANDYRLARFVDKSKVVNPNWAAKLIEEVSPTNTKSRVVSCDGGGGPTGHPKVYINLDKPGNHSCSYCGLRFKKDGGHH